MKRRLKKSKQKKKWIVSTIAFLFLITISIFVNFSQSLGFQNGEDLKKELNNTQQNKQISLEEKLIVHVLDVGQGDSIFIELPNNQTMLIDAGEAQEADKIINYIKDRGYSKLDYVIGTHPHADHIGGLAKIIHTFPIQSIYMPKAVSTSKTYENLLTTILEKNLKVKTAKSGVNILEEEQLKLEFVAPNKDSYKELNNFSSVLKITYGNRKFLFMGDAEEESEREIKTDISADVIKIGHHGSKSSSSKEFVSLVHPKYAIVSVGKENKYNHPNEEIINRWKSVGAEIYLTSTSGTITIESDGEEIQIITEKET